MALGGTGELPKPQGSKTESAVSHKQFDRQASPIADVQVSPVKEGAELSPNATIRLFFANVPSGLQIEVERTIENGIQQNISLKQTRVIDNLVSSLTRLYADKKQSTPAQQLQKAAAIQEVARKVRERIFSGQQQHIALSELTEKLPELAGIELSIVHYPDKEHVSLHITKINAPQIEQQLADALHIKRPSDAYGIDVGPLVAALTACGVRATTQQVAEALLRSDEEQTLTLTEGLQARANKEQLLTVDGIPLKVFLIVEGLKTQTGEKQFTTHRFPAEKTDGNTVTFFQTEQFPSAQAQLSVRIQSAEARVSGERQQQTVAAIQKLTKELSQQFMRLCPAKNAFERPTKRYSSVAQ